MSTRRTDETGEPRPLVIGVGQLFRRDDGVGRVVAAAVRERAAATIDVVSCDGDSCDLVALWDGRAFVVVVDAMRSGAAPGALAEFDVDAQAGVKGGRSGLSTHAHGVISAVALARALGRLPAHLRILAIEVADIGWGEGLTPEVDTAAGAAVDRIVDSCRRPTPRMPPAGGAG